MNIIRSETFTVKSSEDVIRVRQNARLWMVEHKFSLIDQTKMVTAVSELARNAVDYGGGGIAIMEMIVNGDRYGIKIAFEDHGQGIPDIEKALQDGFTTGGGLGMGLGGSKRLVNEFDIWSKPGEGTRITITRWK